MELEPLEEVLELLADRRFDEALSLLDRTIEEIEDDAPLLALRAMVLAEHDRLDEAWSQALAAHHSDPDHPYVCFALGEVALARGEVLDAITAAQQAQRVAPFFTEAILLEARARSRAGQWEHVKELADRVLDVAPHSESAAVLGAVAREIESKGYPTEDPWRVVARQFPLNPVARAGSGWMELRAGNARAARGEFEQALALDPSLTWAREGLVIALKARSPVYRLVLRFFLWIGRFPQRTRNLILIGGFIGYRLLRSLAKSQPELQPFIAPLLIAYLVFVVLTWLADPLLDLMLMLRAETRRLLSQDSRTAALLVVACLTTALVLVLLASIAPNLFGMGLGIGLLSFTISGAYRHTGTKRRALLRTAALAAILLALSAFATGNSGLLLGAGFILIIGGTWYSSLSRAS